MFEVLVYVYENYWQGDACPAPRQLSRKLIAAGFESDEIEAKRLKRNQASRERTKRETVKCECGGSSRANEGAHRENHEASKKHQNWLKNINREGEGDQFADAFYE